MANKPNTEYETYRRLLAQADEILQAAGTCDDEDVYVFSIPMRALLSSMFGSLLGEARTKALEYELKYKETARFADSHMKSKYEKICEYLESTLKKINKGLRYSEMRHRVSEQIQILTDGVYENDSAIHSDSDASSVGQLQSAEINRESNIGSEVSGAERRNADTGKSDNGDSTKRSKGSKRGGKSAKKS